MKKLIALLLSLALCLALVACGGAKKEETAAPADGVTTYKVGVAIFKFDDNFMTLYRNEIAD